MRNFITLLRRAGLAAAVLVAIPGYAFAHVKWFSQYNFAERPLGLDEICSPLFYALLLTSLLSVGVLITLDARLVTLRWYERFCNRLRPWETHSTLVLRVAIGSVLLLSWHAGAFLVPEIPSPHPVVDLLQLGIAFVILANFQVRYAGLALLAMYAAGLVLYGFLHMLDYAYLVGAAYFLVASASDHRKTRASGLPALYASVGFSLCWVALEKLIYPQWGLAILQERPVLTMGFEPAFFLTSSAFVEFTLGFLLIVCLLQRPIAIAVTGLFMTTTLVFGKMEFVGHAIVHATMIVFLICGQGDTFRTPITFFRHRWQQVTFASVAFLVLFGGMLTTYGTVAYTRYEAALHGDHLMVPGALATWQADHSPEVMLDITPAPDGAWTLRLTAKEFVFQTERAGGVHVPGEGHAHLYVDDRKIARMYEPVFTLPALSPGPHEIEVALATNDHRPYVHQGQPLVARATIDAP